MGSQLGALQVFDELCQPIAKCSSSWLSILCLLMASSSSSVPDWKYDVFLNFRGEDTRRTFIGHLYKALVQNSINTFVDAEILTVPEESSYVEEMRQQEEMRQRHLEEMRQRKEMRQRGRRLEETRQRHLEAMSLRRRMEAMRQRRF